MDRQNKKGVMRDYTFTLTAGQELERNIPGNWFHVIDSDSDIQIRFDDGDTITRSEGMGGSAEYEKVTIISAAAQTVKVSLGYGFVTDGRATVNESINTTIEPSNSSQGKAEVVVGAGLTVALVGANINRKELRVGIKSTEANGVYVGDSGIGAAKQGGYIEEGSVDYIAIESALYAYNAGAGSITVNLMELERI